MVDAQARLFMELLVYEVYLREDSSGETPGSNVRRMTLCSAHSRFFPTGFASLGQGPTPNVFDVFYVERGMTGRPEGPNTQRLHKGDNGCHKRSCSSSM